MSCGLEFHLAPFCGADEQYTWHAEAPEGLEHAEIAAKLAQAGFRVRMDSPSLRFLESPSAAMVTLRAGQPVQVRVAMGLPLAQREPALRQEQARLNTILGLAAPSTAVAAASGVSQAFQEMLAERIRVIQDVYLNEPAPLVVGYSGGKDSTATLMLVWEALRQLPTDQRSRPVHVVSTDTGVENPVVAKMTEDSLEAMRRAAREQGLPIAVSRLKPTVADSFWVMVIGRGYAVPRPLFRWCTARLKVSPANTYVMDFVEQEGGVIQVLGTRRSESAARARSMERHESGRTRPFLSPNASLKLEDGRRKSAGAGPEEPKAHILSPIEDWDVDQVWTYLTRFENPWGHDNAHITSMYASASDASECPMTLDASQGDAPSCGKSRFGCWTCTMVSEEKSLTSFLINDPATFGWLQPLLDLRNRLSPRQGDSDEAWSDGNVRSHYRVQNDRYYLFHGLGKHIKGRYIQAHREDLLRDLLAAQARIQAEGPDWARSFELITLEELEAIRDLWISLWNEIEDSLPVIYEEVLGRPYPGPARKPLLRDARSRVAALRAAADKEAQALGMDGRLLFEQAREVLVMDAKRCKSATVAERPLSTDEIFHRHQVHSLYEADGMARREESRRRSIKRVLAAAEGKGAAGALNVFDVVMDLGGISAVASNVVAADPAEAVRIATQGWMAQHSDHAEAWGLTETAVLAGAKATWLRAAPKGVVESALKPVPGWWAVRFNQMDWQTTLLVKASHAREAVALAALEATEYADVLALELDTDPDTVRLLVADDWENPPMAMPRRFSDAEALPLTLRTRALRARGALVEQPGLFEVVSDRRGTRGFLEDWMEEVS